MPYTDHNDGAVLDLIRIEADQTRDLLRKLRHIVEQGHLDEPPLRLITELGRHASVLLQSVQQFTVRHEVIDEISGELHHNEYEPIMTFVDNEARRDPNLLSAPVNHLNGPNDYELYRELGFSDQEYADLLTWKKSWVKDGFDVRGAFDTFGTQVVAELQGGRYSLKVEDVVPGIAGIVGIAVDVTFFASAANVPSLVSSCTTGLAAIALKFGEVRRKLLGRSRRVPIVPLGDEDL